MTTLCIRDVPETVVARLKDRAAEEGQSLSAYVATQLEVIASRPSLIEMAARLRMRDRSTGASREQIIDTLRDSRR